MNRSSDPADTLREYYDPETSHLEFMEGEFTDGEVTIPGHVDGQDARLICRPVAVVLTGIQEGVMALDEEDDVSFEASQGRGAGRVTDIRTEDADVPRRVILSRDDEEDVFALTHNGADQNVTAEIGEYNPEANAYDWWPVGAVTDLSLD